MSSLSFTVYGSPIAQPRARSRAIMVNGKLQVRAYEPETIKEGDGIRRLHPAYEWKQLIAAAARAVAPAALWSGPLHAEIKIYFSRPGRLMKKKDPDGPVWHIGKPDRDNVEKAILDALKGVVFVDDCQVCDGSLKKFYHEKTGRPRAEIRLEEIAL